MRRNIDCLRSRYIVPYAEMVKQKYLNLLHLFPFFHFCVIPLGCTLYICAPSNLVCVMPIFLQAGEFPAEKFRGAVCCHTAVVIIFPIDHI